MWKWLLEGSCAITGVEWADQPPQIPDDATRNETLSLLSDRPGRRWASPSNGDLDQHPTMVARSPLVHSFESVDHSGGAWGGGIVAHRRLRRRRQLQPARPGRAAGRAGERGQRPGGGLAPAAAAPGVPDPSPAIPGHGRRHDPSRPPGRAACPPDAERLARPFARAAAQAHPPECRILHTRNADRQFTEQDAGCVRGLSHWRSTQGGRSISAAQLGYPPN